MSITNIENIRNAMIPVLEHNNVKKAILFGSYAKNKATNKSDIDLLVDSGLKGFSFLALLGELRETLGLEVDLFDVSHIEEGSVIDLEIKNTGVLLYEK